MLANWENPLPVPERSSCAQSGFTVIEILVTLVLAAIVLGMALPSLQQFSANHQVVSASNNIVTGLNFARFSAINSGDDITICPSQDGTSCNNDAWDQSWIVFQDQDADSVPDSAEVLRVAAVDSSIDASGFGQAIVFDANGITNLGSDAIISNCFEDSDVTSKCVDVTVNAFGSIESEARTGESTSPAE